MGAIIRVGVVRTGRIDAQTGRTVGKHYTGNAQTGNGRRVAGGTGNGGRVVAERTGSRLHATPAATYYELCFFMQCHGCYYLVDVVGGQLGCRLTHHDRCAGEGCTDSK